MEENSKNSLELTPKNSKFIRIKGLDFLRGLAILMVLFRHSNMNNILFFFGWLGVDLFFVMSGFLISSLLFREYQKSGTIRIKRFLIRRGFKIYPSFYILIIFSIVFHYLTTHQIYSWEKILNEIFYLQSYGSRIWDQTWSLAVEEHFYFSMALIMFFAVKRKGLENIRKTILILCSILIFSFLLRYQVSLPHKNEIFYFSKTHLRTDGIVVGVLTSYLYYFTDFFNFFKKKKLFFLVLAVVLVSPAFVMPGGSFFMNTFGLTTANLSFGIFLLFSLDNYELNVPKFIKIFFDLICLIGVHSYSIYLWHLFVRDELEKLQISHNLFLFLFFIISIVLGISLSFVIEKPFLRLREKVTARYEKL